MRKAKLLSYPRSGNTWLRYIVERISGYRTVSGGQRSLIGALRNNSESVLQKDHWVSDHNLPNLVVLLRDYHEVLVRHPPKGCTPKQSIHMRRPKPQRGVDYLHILEHFEKFRPENRYLIYYEDLMTDPIGTVTHLFSWLGLPTARVKDFFSPENYAKEIERGLSIYSKVGFRSATKGLMLKWHRYRIEEDIHRYWDHYVKENYPSLFKYVERYSKP